MQKNRIAIPEQEHKDDIPVMKTVKGYHRDAYRTEFNANVIRTTCIDGRRGVALDHTLFYPTSGGQPHDTGTLQGMPVIDVIQQDQGIIHILGRGSPSGSVTGRIDWHRRFDHMQQHTGQHILSQAFLQILDAETVGFHLGDTMSTLDLTVSALNWEAVHHVENEANRVVFQNLPVRIHEVPKENLQQFPLRKLPVVKGQVRIIEIKNYDWSACGGTHVRATGEIGLIAIHRFERFKQGSRVTFFCGHRALKLLQKKTELLKTASQRLTSSEDGLIAGIDKLFMQQKQLKKCEKALLIHEADARFRKSQDTGVFHFVHNIFTNREPKSVQALCRQITENPKTVCLFGIRGQRAMIILGQSEDGPLDLARLAKLISRRLDGKGGGNSRQIQVSGTNPDLLMPALKELEDRIKSAVTSNS